MPRLLFALACLLAASVARAEDAADAVRRAESAAERAEAAATRTEAAATRVEQAMERLDKIIEEMSREHDRRRSDPAPAR